MILIKTIRNEPSSNEVIEWLRHYKIAFTSLTNEILGMSEIYINSSNLNSYLKYSEHTLEIAKISSFWYRRKYLLPNSDYSFSDDYLNAVNLNLNINKELSHLEEYVYYLIQNKTKGKFINSPFKGDLNRLKVFNEAKRSGLKVPEFIVTNLKKHVVNFLNKHKSIVLKPISNVQMIEKKDMRLLQYTKLVEKKEMKRIPPSFFPSLFQQYFEKEFEIRTFFLDGKFYSMAMFTQSNTQTAVDFRKYDYANPTRRVPFDLPKNIQLKLKKLFDKLELNCGSVDILYTKENEYVFLEINPVGQFGMVSYPCNYYLERTIAKTLSNYAKKN